jgi:hypothetical protein
MHLCFAIPWGTSWKPFIMFFHMIWTHVWLSLFHCSWSFICVLFHVITWLLNFFYRDDVFHAHVLSSLISALNALPKWSRLCWCMLPQKLFLLLSLTYSRMSRSNRVIATINYRIVRLQPIHAKDDINARRMELNERYKEHLSPNVNLVVMDYVGCFHMSPRGVDHEKGGQRL